MNNELSLMEKFADPNLIEQLSFGDKMAGAGITTLMGMGITFLVLCLIWLVLAIMGKIMRSVQSSKDAKAAPAAAAPVAATPVAGGASAENLADDKELVAVIAAAIAAYEGASSANNLVVKKITRIGGDTAWSSAGKVDCLESRNMVDKRK